MRQDVDETFEMVSLELLRRTLTHGDQSAWAAFQRCLNETVLTWLHNHPGREAACREQSEEHFVALAFERFRQSVAQGQVTCETLTGALVYLRASLHGTMLEVLRVSSCPKAVSEHRSGKGSLEDHPESREVWDWLQARLTSERERRLAYLLYHCGMEPREIVRCCPQEWSDVHEVARLRRLILVRLMQEPDR